MPFRPTYFTVIRKSFSLINGIAYELLNASLFLRETERFMGMFTVFIYPNHYMFETSIGPK